MYFCTRLRKCYLLKQTSTLHQQKSKSPHNHQLGKKRLLMVTHTSTTSATWHVLFCSHCTKARLVTPRVTRSLSLYISINFTSWEQKAEVNSNPNVICDSSREGSSKTITTCYHCRNLEWRGDLDHSQLSSSNSVLVSRSPGLAEPQTDEDQNFQVTVRVIKPQLTRNNLQEAVIVSKRGLG